MLKNITSETTYIVLALLGIIIIAVPPYLISLQSSQIEQQASSLFEQHILTKLDIQSTQENYFSLQQVINAASETNSENDTIEYSDSQLKLLIEESVQLNQQLEQLSLKLIALDSAKASLIKNVKMKFFLALIIMVLGMTFAIFGALGWYFHVHIYEERRLESREDT